MASCQDCLHFEVCEALEQGNGLMKVPPIHCGCYKPTADVVPKSEVEREYGNALQTAFNDGRLEGGKEVAREIFEEIEKMILDNTYPDFDSKHKPVNVWKATTGYDAFYELKKKYTEGVT